MENEKVRARESFEIVLADALKLTDQVARDHGVDARFEDIIDSVWADLPTQWKLDFEIPTDDGSMRSAILAWQEVDILPPKMSYANTDPERDKRWADRKRILRKKAILSDLLNETKILAIQAETGRMLD